MTSKIIAGICLLLGLSMFVFGNEDIVTRMEWNAKEPTDLMEHLDLPVGRVIIAHTAGNDCNTKDRCSQEVRNIQHFHMTKYHYDDIGYNYLIGNDGNVYEGRGFKYQGALAKGYNAGSIGIVFMGNFNKELPNEKALAAGKSLLEKLVKLEKLKEDYKLYGHRQLLPTISPGDALFDEIKTWPKWTNQV